MTTTQFQLFWREVRLIQKRHQLFFSIEDMAYIQVSQTNHLYQVTYHTESKLPDAVKLEVNQALGMVLG